jgi:hypothetical protein
MNRILKRPMFRMGGSANSGITSGLDTTKPKRGLVDEPGGYAGRELPYDLGEILKSTKGQMTPELLEAYKPYLERPKGEAANRFLTTFGLDLMSRPSSGSGFKGLLTTAAKSAKEPTSQLYQDIDSRRITKAAAEGDLFKTLLQGNLDIAAEAAGEGGAAKTYEKLEIAKALEEIMPRFIELKQKRKDGLLEEGDELELRQLQEKYNRFSAKNLEDDLLMEIYSKGLGDRAVPNRIEELYNEDARLGENRKYKSPNDPQIKKDAIESIRQELQSIRTYADGGRAGYMNGGPSGMAQDPMAMEQAAMPTDQGSMDDGANNLISYDQLRARLPNEITDDIVELMSNSAEALEDFAMISSQQEVDQFNKKYSVNLVLPGA